MDDKQRLLAFVQRTRKNLRVTEKWRKDHPTDGFSEVTNLINSLLGLIIAPTEENKTERMKKILDEIDQPAVEPTGIRRWQAYFIIDGDAPPKDLPSLLFGLRNAIAHYAFEYVPDGAGNITGVIFHVVPWGRRGKPPPPPWDATFTLSELLTFLDGFADEVEKVCKKRARREPSAGH